MIVVLISDIHANAVALRSLDDVLMQADVVVCLGDLIGYYCEVNEVIDTVRAYKPICVLGNHDDFLLHGYPDSAPDHVKWAVDYADGIITAENREYLSSLPLVWRGVLGGRRFLLSHGSPWRPLADYLYHGQCNITALREFDVDIIAVGQTHRPWMDKERRPFVINVGSVGQSRHIPARACGVVIDSDTLTIEAIDRHYDPTPVIQLARRWGAQEWITKHMC
jgi:putative phosphoesterase